MFNPDFLANAVPARMLAAGVPAIPPTTIVEDEPAWRVRPAGAALSAQKIVPTRWHSLDQCRREVCAQTPADGHVVAIVLRNEDVWLSISGRVLYDGRAIPGMVQVTEPGASARCVFRGPYDVLHLHVPNALIAEVAQENGGGEIGTLRADMAPTQDPVAERLGRSLLAAEESDRFGELYADCVSTAIVARLLASTRRPAGRGRSKVPELAKWRLKRVTEYVEANLGEPVRLADLASAAGLTRMHFAAQFRAATGLPPHEYLLRRRIEHAQEMLVQEKETLVEIALSVGFQSQSHFTSVFKRFVGQPPRAWRQCHGKHRAGSWKRAQCLQLRSPAAA